MSGHEANGHAPIDTSNTSEAGVTNRNSAPSFDASQKDTPIFEIPTIVHTQETSHENLHLVKFAFEEKNPEVVGETEGEPQTLSKFPMVPATPSPETTASPFLQKIKGFFVDGPKKIWEGGKKIIQGVGNRWNAFRTKREAEKDALRERAEKNKVTVAVQKKNEAAAERREKIAERREKRNEAIEGGGVGKFLARGLNAFDSFVRIGKGVTYATGHAVFKLLVGGINTFLKSALNVGVLLGSMATAATILASIPLLGGFFIAMPGIHAVASLPVAFGLFQLSLGVKNWLFGRIDAVLNTKKMDVAYQKKRADEGWFT